MSLGVLLRIDENLHTHIAKAATEPKMRNSVASKCMIVTSTLLIVGEIDLPLTNWMSGCVGNTNVTFDGNFRPPIRISRTAELGYRATHPSAALAPGKSPLSTPRPPCFSFRYTPREYLLHLSPR